MTLHRPTTAGQRMKGALLAVLVVGTRCEDVNEFPNCPSTGSLRIEIENHDAYVLTVLAHVLDVRLDVGLDGWVGSRAAVFVL